MQNEILNAALEYATRGWFVLPLNPGSKVADVLLPEQLDFDWNTDVRPDEATIRRWFEIEPDLNIGIRLLGSGLTVVDVDVLDKWLIWHSSEDPLVIDVPLVKTQRGQHYFFAATENDRCGVIWSDKGEYIADCLTPYPPEWRPADRSYVVAPPSKHPSFGHVYEWGITPDEGRWTTLPHWIRQAVREPVEPSSWWADYDEDEDRRCCPYCGEDYCSGSCAWDYEEDEPYPEDFDE